MEYYRPTSFDDLQNRMSKINGQTTTILAGGTDVIPRWELDETNKPGVIVDIKKIPQLSGIEEDKEFVTIGALTTIQEIKNSAILQKHFSAIAQAADQFAGVQIRHRATIGGNICNASPAGDLLPGLYAHNGELTLVGENGKRSISIVDFIRAPGKTAIKPHEILTSIKLKKEGEKSIFYKLGLRQSMAISVVNFAIAYARNSDGEYVSLTIAAGSVAPTIVYLKDVAKSVLAGKTVEESIELVGNDINPIDDIRATGNYRCRALKNVLGYYFRYDLDSAAMDMNGH